LKLKLASCASFRLVLAFHTSFAWQKTT